MKDIKLRFWNTDYKNPIMEYGSIRDLDKMYRAQDKNIMLSTGLQDFVGLEKGYCILQIQYIEPNFDMPLEVKEILNQLGYTS